MEKTIVAGVEIDTRHFIGGQRVSSLSTFADYSPIDGSHLADIARGTTTEVELAISQAQKAFPVWSLTSVHERARILHRIADLVEERLEELSIVETEDNGALLRSHRRAVMPRVAHNFRFFADWLVNDLTHPDFEIRGHRNHVTWDPSGIAVLITPWNAPLLLATWKIAPALAAGDTVILKPAEWTPLTASLFADITRDAGLPDGVFNLVQGLGEEVGAALTEHPRISRISFTGSVETAKIVARAAASNLTPCSFELGGKSPTIITDDADLELAVKIAIDQYDNAGQVCLSGTRLLVQRGISAEFKTAFLARAALIRQGDPRTETTEIGPQIHPEHFTKVKGFVDRAKKEGHTVILGGEPNSQLGGNYYLPTLIENPSPGSEIVTEEIFGPVLTLQYFDNDAEALAMANGSEFGLAAVLICGDKERAAGITEKLVAGTVWVNCFFVRDLRAPFGGSKKSGIGREGGSWSFDFYADIKNTVFSPEGWKD